MLHFRFNGVATAHAAFRNWSCSEPSASVPLDVAAVGTLLLPSESIGQGAGLAGKEEVEAGIRRDDHAAGHGEAMQVAGQGDSRHGEFLVVEVVAGGEADVPAVRDADVSRAVQRLGELVGIAHSLGIDFCGSVFPHGDTVADGEVPRYLELEVTVLVDVSGVFLHDGLPAFPTLRVDVLHGGVSLVVVVIVVLLVVLVATA